MIDNILIKQAAAAQGVSVDEFLRTRIENIAVPEEDVESEFERRKSQFPAALPAEAKYRIRRELEDRRRGRALTELVKELRSRAEIVFHESSRKPNPAAGARFISGDPNAPVTVVLFLDYECPYSRSAYVRLRQWLPEWTPYVRLVIRHFPLSRHTRALEYARYAVCAGEQGHFWTFSDALLATRNPDTFTDLEKITQSLGLDRARLKHCLQGGKTDATINSDVAVGRAIGVERTPTILVDGREVAGLAQLRSVVETKLQKVQLPSDGGRNR